MEVLPDAQEYGKRESLEELQRLAGSATGYGNRPPHGQVESVRALATSAESGAAKAMLGLGRKYENGWGVRRDYGKALDWYRRAAEAGSTAAMESVGNLYLWGRGVPRDIDAGRRWREAAFDNFERDKTGAGVPSMICAGFCPMHLPAPQEEPVARLGLYLHDGPDPRILLRKARAGDVWAMTKLGSVYLEGAPYWGLDPKPQQGRRWLERAAVQGDVSALKHLAWAYDIGRGVHQDRRRARALYQRVAETGDGRAMERVAEMYAFGEGGPKNQAEADRWCARAAQAMAVPIERPYGAGMSVHLTAREPSCN